MRHHDSGFVQALIGRESLTYDHLTVITVTRSDGRAMRAQYMGEAFDVIQTVPDLMDGLVNAIQNDCRLVIDEYTPARLAG